MILFLSLMLVVMIMAIAALFATKIERVVTPRMSKLESGITWSLDNPVNQDQARELGLRLAMNLNQRVGGF